MALIIASIDVMLALVLASASAHKLFAFGRLSDATSALAGTSQQIGRVLNVCAAVWEGLAALLILTAVGRFIGLGMAAALWCTYGLLTWHRGQTGEPFDCGCSFGRHRENDPLKVLKPFVLSIIAVIGLASGTSPAFDTNAVFAGLAYFGFYLAVEEFAALAPLARRTSR